MVSVSTVPPGGGTTFLTQTVGLWSPAPSITFGNAAVGLTMDAATAANFSKTGRHVFATGYAKLSAKGSSTGIARLVNLPYGVSLAGAASPALGIHSLTGVSGPIFLDLLGTEGAICAADGTLLTDANFTDTTFIEFAFGYLTT